MRPGSPCVCNRFRRPTGPAPVRLRGAIDGRDALVQAGPQGPQLLTERRDGSRVARQGRSAAQDARSALTRRPARSYAPRTSASVRPGRPGERLHPQPLPDRAPTYPHPFEESPEFLIGFRSGACSDGRRHSGAGAGGHGRSVGCELDRATRRALAARQATCQTTDEAAAFNPENERTCVPRSVCDRDTGQSSEGIRRRPYPTISRASDSRVSWRELAAGECGAT